MISVIIPCCSEEHCDFTVQSVLSNAVSDVEVIVVDDRCRLVHDFPAEVKHIHTPGPLHGVDIARHFGIQHATGDVLVIMDAHMSVEPEWDSILLSHFRETDVACVSCRHDADHWQDPSEWGYCGAWMQAVMSDPAYYGHSILQPKWASMPSKLVHKGKRAPVPCVLGAFYVMTARAYKDMGEPWQYLQIWGWSEQLLSIAAWAKGYDTVCLPVKTGHCYRKHGPRPFIIPSWSTVYNQYFLAHTLPMSAKLRGELISHLDKDRTPGRRGDHEMCDRMLQDSLPSPLTEALADGRPLDEYFEYWENVK